MASKFNRCSDHQIEEMLDLQSDSDTEEPIIDKLYLNKLQKKKNVKSQNAMKNILNITSDTENVSHYFKKTSNSKDESVAFKIKLRRSTEQSLYKIDTKSGGDKPTHKFHNEFSKQRKESRSKVEMKESRNENENDAINIDANDNDELKEEQNKTEVHKSTRNRRPPLRFSSYHCDTLPMVNSSPSLRNRRKNINYNEDKLFIDSILTSLEVEQRSATEENKELDVASDSHNSTHKSLNSNIRNNKRQHISSLKDNESNSDTDTKIIKMKIMKKSSKSENRIESVLDNSPERKEIAEKANLLSCITTTPVKTDKQKRMIFKSKQKNIQYTNNNNEDGREEEHLVDMYKRIKISSAVKTPTSINKSKRTISEDIQNTNDKIDTEVECLNDTNKNNKILSVKKNILTPRNQNNVQKSIESRLEETHLNTPKSRSIKCSNLTPLMRKRNSLLVKPVTPLQEARSRLHVCAVPKSLPCREEEFNNIFTFLRGKLEDKTGGCIYISGVPGTGKTATVNEAVRCLQKLISKGQLDDFDYVAINGMKLTEPRQAYVQILKQLDGRTATWEQAYHILDKRFHRANPKMTLLLVDELDFLCTKRQDVVYNLLDWPTKATAQLVVITIANTMDLPERVLMGRVTSRLGLTRLTFQPYNYKQLQEIVMSRLKGFNGFRNEAVQLVARKVSAVSGDARRALDICRRAMEIGESRNAEIISLQDVTAAVAEMIASAKVQAIKHCSKMEQIFLQAVSAEVTRTSVEEVYFKDAYYQVESLCSFNGVEVPTVTETLAVCARLGASRLLICEHSRNDIYQKILLNVSIDDIHYAIHNLDLHSE